MKKIFGFCLLALICSIQVTNCKSIVSAIVTDAYDVQLVNKMLNVVHVHAVGSHFEKRYTLGKLESRKDVIHVESYSSYSGYYYGSSHRRAQITVAVTDPVGQKQYSNYVWLYHPGSTLINIGPNGVGAFAVAPNREILGQITEDGSVVPIQQ